MKIDGVVDALVREGLARAEEVCQRIENKRCCVFCARWTEATLGLAFWSGSPGAPRLSADNEGFLIRRAGQCALRPEGELTVMEFGCDQHEKGGGDG